MESIEIIERVIKNINSFNVCRVGDVTIAFIALAVLFALALKAINISSIEGLFMNKKQKIVKDFFVLMFFLIVFTAYNLILLIFPELLLVIDFFLFVGCSLVSFLIYLFTRFYWSKRQSAGNSKKKIDWNEVCNKLVMYTVICMMPWLAAIIKIEAEKIPLINCALIAGVIGVILIYFSMPSLLIKRSSNYFMWIYRCAESACPVFWKSPVRTEEITVPDR